MSSLLVEHVRVIYLTGGMRCIADEVHQKGTVDAVYMYPREIVKRALELSASNLILVHNHPSGNVEPSLEDIGMIFRLQKMAVVFGVDIFDHMIIGGYCYYSFREKGILVE